MMVSPFLGMIPLFRKSFSVSFCDIADAEIPNLKKGKKTEIESLRSSAAKPSSFPIQFLVFSSAAYFLRTAFSEGRPREE